MDVGAGDGIVGGGGVRGGICAGIARQPRGPDEGAAIRVSRRFPWLRRASPVCFTRPLSAVNQASPPSIRLVEETTSTSLLRNSPAANPTRIGAIPNLSGSDSLFLRYT